MVRRLVVLLSLAAPAGAGAQPFPVEDLPPDLRPWVSWVLDAAPEAGCPRVQGRAVCVWPGRLELDLAEDGGRFQLAARAERETDLRLPGDAARWPQAVVLDGREAPVFERGGAPAVRVGPGAHVVSGRFRWARLPESLAAPPELGLLALSLDGRPVDAPRRESNGLVWLRARTDAPAGAAESLRLQVFRRVEDGIPITVETRLELEVSGRAREVELDGTLLEDSVPVSVEGDLPARLEDGRLRVQVRGGRFAVRVRARVEGRRERLARPETGAGDAPVAWPDGEVWVFAADERLRRVDVAGAPGVEPSRTGLPSEWQHLPAFQMASGAALDLTERRRGQPEPPPDAIALTRELWLDPSGDGFTVRDRFAGLLGGTTRLDVLAPGELGRVIDGGEPQLVTGADGATGVELRRQALQLTAELRLPRDGAIGAVGWAADVESLGARLHLPPGWTLLGSTGVDSLSGTWSGRWNLMSFFFVLLTAFAALRVFGPRTALVALAALVLAHGEGGTPWLVWLSLLAATALRGAAGEGRLGSLARIWWLASAAVLLVQLVPFAADQLRVALFPQTGSPGFVSMGRAGGLVDVTAPQPAAAPPEGVQPESFEEVLEAPRRQVLEQESKLAYQAAPPPPPPPVARPQVAAPEAQEPSAVIQTGPGVPTWQWREHTLTWSGPVGREHRFRLLLLSPGVNLALTLLRLALLALLAARLLSWPRPLRLPGLPPAAALVALFALPGPARAAEPPGPQLLEELRQRLTRPAPCEPACVTTPGLVLAVREQTLRVTAEVHAAALGSWPVPGPPSSWTPARVLVDGAPSGALARLGDGFLHVRLAPGVHRVEVTGPAPAADSFTLQFGQLPRRAQVDAPGWDSVGFRDDAPPDGSVQLARRLRPGDAARDAGGGPYPPWLVVTRTLQLGVNWWVHTEVQRVSPPGTPLALSVPLLDGEAPTDPSLEPQDGAVAVALGRDEVRVAWASSLEPRETLVLTAPEGRPWNEVWQLQCNPIWACRAVGPPPTGLWADARLEPAYHPWPGETLDLAFQRREGVAGPSLTVEKVTLRHTPGVRLETADLALAVRTSREQPLEIGLPADADLRSLDLDGAPRDERPDDAGRLRLAVPRGDHRVALSWQRERGVGLLTSLPEVTLPEPAVNAELTLELPANRWLLLTWGPSWGPAVIFWGYLLFVLAAAAALGRLPGSPLRTAEWLLLGLGLSQIDPVGALLVAGFFFALARRGRGGPAGAWAFDALQVVLLAWTLVAAGLLYAAVQSGLLFRPDMQVQGAGSTDTLLRWFAPRLAGAVPGAGAMSAPLWLYRALMLVWAVWLASRLVGWAGWAWRCFSAGGAWRRPGLPDWLRPRRRVEAPASAPEARAPEPGDGGPETP